MRLLAVLLLALLTAGCSQVAETPAAQTVQVGDRYVSFVPPQGWKRDGSQWFKMGQGRLTVEVFRTDAADPVTAARAWYERRAGSLRVESLEPETVAGRPGALGVGQDPYRDVYTALFVPYQGHLVVFRVNSPDRPGTVERLRRLGLQFDVPAPAASPVVATETPPPTAGRGGFDWERWLQPVILPGLFLLFTALPAWVGAGFGYDSAGLTGQDVRRAAAGGAFQATGCGLALGCLLISLGLFVLMAGKGSSGIMSAEMAWLLLTFMLLVVGFFMGLAGGALAGVDAWLGAAHSRRQAQVMAAVLAVGGALLGPFVLRAFLAMEPSKRKRRAELPRVPITVVLPGPVQEGPS